MLKPEFVSNMNEILGKESEALFKAIENTSSPVSIRINPAKSNRSFAEPVSWASNAGYLAERPVFTADPLFHAGTYYVQEASSMYLEQAVKQTVDLEKPLVVLDLCAAPGGKSTLLTSLLKENDVLISNEINKTRADVLTENIQKWGLPNNIVTRNKPSDFSDLIELFDLIVVDAPCSGEGMFRKTPDAIKEWSPENVRICVERQQEILEDIWPSLKPGGTLIYSTCTYNLEENELQAQWMMDELEAEGIEIELKAAEITPSLMEGISAARFMPHKSRGEGFFITAVRKPAYQGSRIKSLKPTIPVLEKKEQAKLAHILTDNSWTYFSHRNQIFAASPELTAVVNRISPHLYPLTLGVALGEMKGSDLIPSPGLAFSTALNPDSYQAIEVSKDQALALLSRETPTLDASFTGWILVKYQGQGLLWLKMVQNRYNNYYPKEWRIRSDYRTLED